MERFCLEPGLNCLNDSQCAKRSRINHSRTENDGKIFKPLELLVHDRGKSVLRAFYPIFRIKLFHSNENVSSTSVSQSYLCLLLQFSLREGDSGARDIEGTAGRSQTEGGAGDCGEHDDFSLLSIVFRSEPPHQPAGPLLFSKANRNNSKSFVV